MRPFLLRLSFLVAATALPRPVDAHKPILVRELVLQVDDQGAAALWRLVLPGSKAQMLQAMVGILARAASRSPQQMQQQILARALVQKAAHGVEILWDDKPLTPGNLTTHLEVQKNRSLDAVGLVTLAGMQNKPQSPSQHSLSIRLLPGQGDLEVQVQTLGAWTVTHTDRSAPATDSRGLRDPVFLRAGDQILIQMRHGPPKEP